MDLAGTGRIPFKDFSGKGVADYVFLEPKNYLQELGVLDEMDPEQVTQVLIPNYVQSLSNCVDVSDYYSVCCLDACGSVMETLEHQVKAPTATVEQLVEATPAAELEFLIVCIASADNAALLKRVAALGIPALSQCAHCLSRSP